MDLVIARMVLPWRYLVLDVALRRHLGQVSRALRAEVAAQWHALCERIRARWIRARDGGVAQPAALTTENLRALALTAHRS